MDSVYTVPATEHWEGDSHPAWDQWCFASQPSFHGSFDINDSGYQPGLLESDGFNPQSIYEPLSVACIQSFLSQGSSTQQPTSDLLNNPEGSSTVSENQVCVPSIQVETKRQKLSHSQGTPAEPSRRNSTRYNQAEQDADEAQDFSLTNEAAHSSPGSSTNTRKRKGNRRAAKKVRVKKRDAEKNLESTEKDMEQMNRDLTAHAKDLSHQVHGLKMQLLQHVNCDCILIQQYIASEADRYIQDIRGEAVVPSK